MGRDEQPSGVARRAWPSFLRGDNAVHIAERLAQGDPLKVRERSARRLREVWFLLEPDRVYLRGLGVCGEAAFNESPPEDLEAWTLAKIDLAIEQLVRRDREAEQDHPEVLDDEERTFALLTDSFFLEPDSVRRVSVAFNKLEELPRRAFFELLIEGRDVGSVIESGPWDEDGLYAAIQAALAPLGLDVPSAAPDDQGRRSKK